MVTIMDASPAKLDLTEACARFEEILAAMPTRELTEDEWSFYLEHDASCSSTHTTAQLEEQLGLAPGALERGDPEAGVLSARELEESTLELVQYLREHPEEPPAAMPNPLRQLASSPRRIGKTSLFMPWLLSVYPSALDRWRAGVQMGAHEEPGHFLAWNCREDRSWKGDTELLRQPGLQRVPSCVDAWAGAAAQGEEPDSVLKQMRILVLFDEMPTSREIPVLRRRLELSIGEFWWAVLAGYRHLTEANKRPVSSRGVTAARNWEVLLWVDSAPSPIQRDFTICHEPHVTSVEHILPDCLHWQQRRQQAAAIGILVPTNRDGDSKEAREVVANAEQAAKRRGTQYVRVHDLLERPTTSPGCVHPGKHPD